MFVLGAFCQFLIYAKNSLFSVTYQETKQSLFYY